MVNLRSKSKAKSVAPSVAPKAHTTPTPPTTLENMELNEEALRKLPRAQLQKLAMAHKVKANIKSELIIQQLSSLRAPKRTRPAESEPEEGSSRKRFKGKAVLKETSISPKTQRELPGTRSTTDATIEDLTDPQLPEAGSSAPRSTSLPHKKSTVFSHDENLFSGTESEMTEEEQNDFATPVSSRAETPPASNVIDLDRCVTIMQQISSQDADFLKEVADVRGTAAKLRGRARDIRDLVKAERGRRERMEAYFRYWQETEPMWDRKWLYGEKMVPDHKIKLNNLDRPAGPPTVLIRQNTQGARNRNSGHHEGTMPSPAQKPTVLLEELKQRREVIVSKQEAEQRQLEALRGGRTESGSVQASSPHDSEGSLDSDDPLDETNEPLTGTGAGTNVSTSSAASSL